MRFEKTAVVIRGNLPSRLAAENHQKLMLILERNLKAALEERKIDYSDSRIFHDTIIFKSEEPDAIVKAASRLFGVVSVSPAIVTESNIDKISIITSALIDESIDTIPKLVVSNLDSKEEPTWVKDLKDNLVIEKGKNNDPSLQPDLRIELTQDFAYMSTQIVKGLGGLPTGSEGHVVCMISSGLDSPIASFKAMRRGCVPIFVYFDNSPFSDDINKEIAIKQAKHLSHYIHGSEVKMFIVPHGEDLVEVLKHAPRRMTCIFCRRNMYRLAQEVALREGADAIITGEIIGEQASQTTRNLYAEDSAICDIPIIRPCIGDDKEEIVRKAREIGTYEFAEEATSCCSLPPKYPTINAEVREIPIAEEKIGDGWVKYAVSDAEVIILKEGMKVG